MKSKKFTGDLKELSTLTYHADIEIIKNINKTTQLYSFAAEEESIKKKYEGYHCIKFVQPCVDWSGLFFSFADLHKTCLDLGLWYCFDEAYPKLIAFCDKLDKEAVHKVVSRYSFLMCLSESFHLNRDKQDKIFFSRIDLKRELK